VQPVEISVSKRDGKEIIHILWTDGHRAEYESFRLRNLCPCAVCQGEPGIFGRNYASTKSEIRPDVVPNEIVPIGSYGMKIQWSDGHDLGIFTFDYLRKICMCAECEKAVA
jgi:DUF971 family protein